MQWVKSAISQTLPLMCPGDFILFPLFLVEKKIASGQYELTFFHFQVDKGNEKGFTYHATKPCTSFERDKLLKTPQHPPTSDYLPLGWHEIKGKRPLNLHTTSR
jgi:hypothetical protein